MSTWMAKTEEADRTWWVIDVADKRLGRAATQIATLLRGKHKPTFTPHADVGDFVVVINADKIQLSGTKWDTKKYYTHSRFFGSLKSKSATQMKDFDPAFIISEAVRGMLPTNKMSYQVIKKLKTYAGSEHPHSAQKPQVATLD